jgi:hypothetical protein
METNITKSLRENSNKIVLDLIALLLVILTIFIPRIMELGQFVTPDEHLWLTRSANFYYALGQRDFAATSPDNKYWNLFLSSDYAVIYVHQWQRGFPKPVVEYIENLTPEHSIWIDGIEYVRIFRIR